MIVLRGSLESVKEHAINDKRVKMWLLSFNKSKFKKWEYIGWDFPRTYPRKHPKYDPSNPDKRKHPEADYFLYYSLTIAGKTYYANVKMHKNYGKEVLYTIEPNKPKKIRSGKPGKE